jgi:hypothetical protein
MRRSFAAVQLMPPRLRTASDPALIEDGAAPSVERKNAHEPTQELHPEVEVFARWFADWWLRRRCAEAGQSQPKRRAA